MSNTDKNENEDVSKTKFSVKEGDIVWHIEGKFICEVLLIRPQVNPKPVIYITSIAGAGSYNNDLPQDEIELILPKEQIHYEEITSNNAIKAFYKGKMVLDLTFEFEALISSLPYVLRTVRRNYIYEQLLEMYPNTKISETIIKHRY